MVRLGKAEKPPLVAGGAPVTGPKRAATRRSRDNHPTSRLPVVDAPEPTAHVSINATVDVTDARNASALSSHASLFAPTDGLFRRR
jgi:hypothetical protein